jgi:CRISPR system Cascade subunit CasC
MFLQIHTLVSYPPSLLNRDDAGLAKRIPFGDAVRLRISSQCLKRHWRDEFSKYLPNIPDGYRSRSFFTREIKPRLCAEGMEENRAQALVKALAEKVVKGGVQKDAELSQPILFGKREADYFVEILKQISSEAKTTEAAVKALNERLSTAEEKKNLAAMSKSASGLTGALFGRFVTSDVLSVVDSCVQVAHAWTIHAADTEMDYFTVVDDLRADDEHGAAHANQSELGAGVYYGYVNIDIPLLVSNLTGTPAKDWREQDSALPRQVITKLIEIISRKSPGAKLGSTAPFSLPGTILLEAGDEFTSSLCNAFLQALPKEQHLIEQANAQMGEHIRRIEGMYGPTAAVRAICSTHSIEAFSPLKAQTLPSAIETMLDFIWKTP